MLKTIAGLQGVNILSREAQKKIFGGSAVACTMTYQDSSGGWHTEVGSCETAPISGQGGTAFVPYCSTASFKSPVTLSSNGGESRCGKIIVVPTA